MGVRKAPVRVQCPQTGSVYTGTSSYSTAQGVAKVPHKLERDRPPPKESVDGPIAAQAELAEGCTVCPTWGKLYRNGNFGTHFGPKNLRFSGLSWGFKSLLLHHFTL